MAKVTGHKQKKRAGFRQRRRGLSAAEFEQRGRAEVLKMKNMAPKGRTAMRDVVKSFDFGGESFDSFPTVIEQHVLGKKGRNKGNQNQKVARRFVDDGNDVNERIKNESNFVRISGNEQLSRNVRRKLKLLGSNLVRDSLQERSSVPEVDSIKSKGPKKKKYEKESFANKSDRYSTNMPSNSLSDDGSEVQRESFLKFGEVIERPPDFRDFKADLEKLKQKSRMKACLNGDNEDSLHSLSAQVAYRLLKQRRGENLESRDNKARMENKSSGFHKTGGEKHWAFDHSLLSDSRWVFKHQMDRA